MVNNISNTNNINNVLQNNYYSQNVIKGNNDLRISNCNNSLPKDTVSFKNLQINTRPLTLNEKKEIKHKARNNASGWSIFGGIISTAYYGLRSSKTIAEKYNLDPIRDKEFIKEIRKDQTLWTLGGALIPGLGSIIPWIYSKCQDSSDMTIKSE